MSTILDDLRKPCLPLTDAAADEIEALESELAQLRAKVEGMRVAAERYEIVRRLNVEEFKAIYMHNLQTGTPFDNLIDARKEADRGN